MPFRSMVDDGVLMPDDLAFLQGIYEEAVAGMANVDDATMQNVAHTLIVNYRAGQTDRDKLIAAAALGLGRNVG